MGTGAPGSPWSPRRVNFVFTLILDLRNFVNKTSRRKALRNRHACRIDFMNYNFAPSGRRPLGRSIDTRGAPKGAPSISKDLSSHLKGGENDEARRTPTEGRRAEAGSRRAGAENRSKPAPGTPGLRRTARQSGKRPARL